MPEFILDTSGDVATTTAWSDLDAFTQGYIEAMFFTETEGSVSMSEWHTKKVQKRYEEGQISSLPSDASFSDLYPQDLRDIIQECAAFQEENKCALNIAYEHAGYDEECAGRDFWFTRNGHGAGFWDRGLGVVGDVLSKACDRVEVNLSFEPDDKSPTGYGYVRIS